MATRTTEELKSEIKKSWGLLCTLRDEARVKVHLGTMDVKKAWNDLQPRLSEAEQAAERAAESASEATLETIKTTTSKLQKLVASL